MNKKGVVTLPHSAELSGEVTLMKSSFSPPHYYLSTVELAAGSPLSLKLTGAILRAQQEF